MSVQIIAIRSIAIAAPLLVCGLGISVPVNSARANNCLAAPNSDAPKGQHWYYHTDRKKGRKCWFLRALLATHAGAAKKPVTVGNAPPLPPLKPQAVSTNSATTQEPVQQSSQEQTAAPSASDGSAAQASVWSRASTPAPVPAITWPDPPMLETATAQKPSSPPSNTKQDTVPASADARVANDSESVAQAGAPPIGAANVAAGPTGTLVQTSLVVALGLILGGVLYRVVRRMSAVRGPRIFVDHSESGWIDDRRVQPREYANEREAFIDDAQLSLVPAAGDYGAVGSFQAEDASQKKARRTGRAARITEQVIERENKLVQLMRDLDHMLQSRKGA